MSTDIKPGQIWAWQDTFDAKGEHGYTFEIIEAGTDVSYQYRGAPGYDPEQTFAASAEVIRANANLVRCVCRAGTEDTCAQHSATPAPLDPKAVNRGDTVTLENGETSVRGPVVNIEHHQDVVVGFAIKNLGWRYIADSVVAQQEDGTWTLTAHQPAPEPEPEWEPGTTGTATVLDTPGVRVMRTDGTVNGVDIAWVSAVHVAGSRMHHAPQVTDFVPDEPRPLPTRQAMASAIAGMPGLLHDSLEHHYDINPFPAADRVYALLRGESR